MDFLGISLSKIYLESGWLYFPLMNILMIGIMVGLFYIGNRKKKQSFFLIALTVGCFLANLPKTGITDLIEYGVLQLFLLALHYQIFPPLFFLGLGLVFDLRLLIANRKLIFLGGAFQVGIFFAFAMGLSTEAISFGWLPNFSLTESASIGMVGTGFYVPALFIASKVAYPLIPAVTVGGFLYSLFGSALRANLVGWLSTSQELNYGAPKEKEVSLFERMSFPLLLLLFIGLTFPLITPLVGMLILGNLIRESGVVDDFASMIGERIMNGMGLIMGLALGLTLEGEKFLNPMLGIILFIGFVGLIVGTLAEIFLLKGINRLNERKERISLKILWSDEPTDYEGKTALQRGQKVVWVIRMLSTLISGGLLLSMTNRIIQ